MSPGLDSQRAHALLERAKGGDSAALGMIYLVAWGRIGPGVPVTITR